MQYRVLPDEDVLDVPDMEENSLSDWVSGNSTWKKAQTSRVCLPNEEVIQAPHLPVHVGSWSDASEYREDMQGFAEKVLRIQKSRSGNRQTKIENREQLRTVAASAPPTTVLEGPSGFDSILQSGSFQVSGAVFFDPLTPLQPNPTIPDASASPDAQLLAREPIKFNYS
jgi:hypothetical protein